MDREANTHNALERMLLDESAEPTDLPLSLLQDITNCFSDDQRISSGGFAVVYKGMVGHGMVAVKKLCKTFDNLDENKFHKEVECLMKAKHKNIVRFLGHCAETQGKVADYEGKFVMADTRNWLLCFEYVPNGSLHKYITDASHELEWGKRYEIIKGICEGLRYLHDKRILHLDLKPNILIDDHMVPKITDFGLSRCLDEEQTQIFTTHLCGSVGYLALEFFRGQFAFASDKYSLGVIIVEILTGEKGYPEDDYVVDIWKDRLEGDTPLEQVRLCTKIGIECMQFDPGKRPAACHIVDRLDKTTSIFESRISSSSVALQVNLLKEQHCQERTENTFAAGTEDVAKCQEKEDQWSAWGSQDTKQERKDGSISSSNSSVFPYVSNLDIIKRKSQRNFVRNGGPTIQQSNSVKIFREEELKTILNISNLVGRGSYGEVYGGVLGNKQVTVRKPIAGSLPDSEGFANEVIERSQVIHRNIVTLIGCCLEVDIPMLVYEFFPNRNLHDILQSNSKVPLNLGVRLRIAAQAADGLAYMHSETNDKILLCGNLEAANILLDDNFVPKISDFGISRLRDLSALPGDYFVGRPAGNQVPRNEGSLPAKKRSVMRATFLSKILDFGKSRLRDKHHFIGEPAPRNEGNFVPKISDFDISSSRDDQPGGDFIGRPANQVPSNEGNFVPKISDFDISSSRDDQPGDYFIGVPANQVFMEDSQLTQQSDVYNFGIIILELISRKKAAHDDNNSLVRNFLESHVEGEKATALFDKEIAGRRDLALLHSLVEIAVECLSADVDARPRMKEVAERLHRLSRTHVAS